MSSYIGLPINRDIMYIVIPIYIRASICATVMGFLCNLSGTMLVLFLSGFNSEHQRKGG